MKKLQIEHKEKELELQSKEEAVNKHKSQLTMVKTNKEYNALQVEIEKMKADNSVLEEAIIVSFEKIDDLKASIQKEKDMLAEEEKKLNSEKSAVGIEIKDLQQKIDQLDAQRKRIVTADLKPEVLDLYERIRQNRGELALVEVRDGSCTGCFVSVRAQVLNDLKLGKLMTCETCSRILYVESDE